MVKEKELGKKLARETKREMERKKEMQREMERVAMTEMAAARQRHIRARITARSEKAREEREKVMAMTLFPQLQVEKERVRADAVGASLVAEEEAQQKGKAEKTEKFQSKKEKKKAKEMKRKARLLKKVRLVQISNDLQQYSFEKVWHAGPENEDVCMCVRCLEHVSVPHTMCIRSGIHASVEHSHFI